MQHERYECGQAPEWPLPLAPRSLPVRHSEVLATSRRLQDSECGTLAYYSKCLGGNSAESDSLCGSCAYNSHTSHTRKIRSSTQHKETATMRMMMMLMMLLLWMMMIIMIMMMMRIYVDTADNLLLHATIFNQVNEVHPVAFGPTCNSTTVKPERNHLTHNDGNSMHTIECASCQLDYLWFIENIWQFTNATVGYLHSNGFKF